jgi:hypothetical protein
VFKEFAGASQTTLTSGLDWASVAYTIPQSADPSATWFNTEVTSVPRDNLGWRISQITRLVKISFAYCPAGTD